MPSPPTPKPPKNNYGWTPERRAAARERALKNKPWEHSTGPKTAAGKARVSQNARKPERTKHLLMLKQAAELLMIHKIFMKKYKFFAYNHMGVFTTNKVTDRENKLIKDLIFQAIYTPTPQKGEKQTDKSQAYTNGDTHE